MAELRSDEDKERHSSWLENFYDLIVAIIVALLAEGLNGVTPNAEITIEHYLGFVFLFAPVYWSWLGVTFYNTRFETDNVRHRILTLLQMGAAAFMAVTVKRGLEDYSVAFALAYAATRTILVVEYIITGKQAKSARPLTGLYSKGFMATTALWIVSVFVPPPFRYYFWFVGLAVDISIPILFTLRVSNRFAPHVYHLPDRFGAFTIIVLGVTILAFVHNIAPTEWTSLSILSAALSLVIAFCIWWIYFDSIDGAAIRAFRREKRLGVYFGWLYVHFPLLIGIVGFGVSIEHIVGSPANQLLQADDRWLMCGSMVLCLVSLGVIRLTSYRANRDGSEKNLADRNQAIFAFVAAGVIILFASLAPEMQPVYLILGIAIVMSSLVALDIKHHPFHRAFKHSPKIA